MFRTELVLALRRRYRGRRPAVFAPKRSDRRNPLLRAHSPFERPLREATVYTPSIEELVVDQRISQPSKRRGIAIVPRQRLDRGPAATEWARKLHCVEEFSRGVLPVLVRQWPLDQEEGSRKKEIRTHSRRQPSSTSWAHPARPQAGTSFVLGTSSKQRAQVANTTLP